MNSFPAGTDLDLKLEASGTLVIPAKVVTCDPQCGSGNRSTRNSGRTTTGVTCRAGWSAGASSPCRASKAEDFIPILNGEDSPQFRCPLSQPDMAARPLSFGDKNAHPRGRILDGLTVRAFALYGMSALPQPNQLALKAL